MDESMCLREIKAAESLTVRWYQELHRIPELELELPQTIAYVCNQLTAMGIDYKVLPGGCGITAVIGKDAPCIGIRADMDALHVQEETGLPFASTNGCMHACGHDGHMAMLLTAAKVLKKHEGELKGSVKLLFQAAEENLQGAKAMITAGCLENPHVDYMLALHAGIMGGDGYASGDVVVPAGVAFFSSDSFRVRVLGKGGHAANPHTAIDPIVTASRIVEAFQTLVSREVKPAIPAVVSVTHIHSGNETYNVIPDEALLMGGVRTIDPQVRVYLKQRLLEVAKTTATAMRAQAEPEFVDGCPALINDDEVTAKVYEALAKALPDSAKLKQEGNSGSEDASYYFEKVPGCYFFLSSYKAIDGEVHPHHNSKFCLDETVLWKGAAALAAAAISLM